jgi:two-component system, sporulation sensor kinase E
MAGRVSKIIDRASKFSTETLTYLLAELNRSVEQGKATLNSIDYGLIVVDDTGYFIHANKLAFTLFQMRGVHKDRALWHSIQHKELREFIELSIQIQTLDAHNDFWIKERLVSCQIKPWVFQGAIKGSLLWVEDITEKRVQQLKMRHIEDMARLGTMSETLAHEIKNPLAAISIHLQLLKKTMAHQQWSPAMEGTYQIISEEIARLGQVVHGYLDVARPLAMTGELTDLSQLVQDALALMDVEARELGISLQAKLPIQTAPRIQLDRGLIKQCLVNLLKNAMQSSANQIVAQVTVGIDRLEVILEDNGSGISQDNLDKIFEPHFTTKKNGNGLGLTIVFKILREHGAYIDVESPTTSDDGKPHGTRITLTFLRSTGEPRQLLGPV